VRLMGRVYQPFSEHDIEGALATFTADSSLTTACRVTASVRVEAALALGRATARAGVQAGAVDRPTS
jgi:hypothetical protein